jgi:hypothetical protein
MPTYLDGDLRAVVQVQYAQVLQPRQAAEMKYITLTWHSLEFPATLHGHFQLIKPISTNSIDWITVNESIRSEVNSQLRVFKVAFTLRWPF